MTLRGWRGFAALALLFATSAIAQDRASHTSTIDGAVAWPATDTRAGPRHVRWLGHIEMRRVAP